jgi:hypothetical protein
MMGMMHFCKDLDCSMENQGDKLVITIKGDKEKIAVVEKKLKALKELCCCCDCGCNCGEECKC